MPYQIYDRARRQMTTEKPASIEIDQNGQVAFNGRPLGHIGYLKQAPRSDSVEATLRYWNEWKGKVAHA